VLMFGWVVVHCSMLAEDAIKSAIKDYRSKSRNVRPTIGPEADRGGAAPLAVA